MMLGNYLFFFSLGKERKVVRFRVMQQWMQTFEVERTGGRDCGTKASRLSASPTFLK